MPSRAARTVAQTLVQADLPESLAAIVRETVRRTRLRRRERGEIARELVSHLEAGLDAGRTPAELIASFGEPRVVAPLLRSAARRRRGRLDRLLAGTLKWGGGGILAIVLVYTALAVRLVGMTPTISFDAYARLQATTPFVPEDQRAWPVYREAMTWHRAHSAAGHPGVIGQSLRDPSATPEARAADVAALRAHADELAMLRRAASMPGLGWDLAPRLSSVDAAWFGDPGPVYSGAPASMLLSLQLPYISVLREAGQLLVADARLAAADGDGRRAVDDLVATLGIARHAGELPVIINQLVESTLVDLVATEAVHALERSPATFQTADLRRLGAALAAIEPDTWRLDLAGEKLWFQDFVQHVYSDNGRGGGVLLPDEAMRIWELMHAAGAGSIFLGDPSMAIATDGGPLWAGAVAGRREVLALADHFYGLVEQESDLPLSQRIAILDQEVARMMSSDWSRLRHPLITLLMPAVNNAGNQRFMVRSVVDGARIAIALEQWRRTHGSWPDRLDDLVPDLLPGVPRDVFDGRPLRYRGDAAGPLVWAVGHDGADDGGLMIDDPKTGTPARRPGRWSEEPADFVLFDGRESAGAVEMPGTR